MRPPDAVVKVPPVLRKTSRPRPARALVALGLAASLTLSLSACSDDGALTLPSLPPISLPSGDQLKQFVADAQGQIDSIGGDLSKVSAGLKDLPDSVRITTADAIERVQEATAQAQVALEDARSSTKGAEDSLAGAGVDLEVAKKKVEDAIKAANGKDAASKETKAELKDLLRNLKKLQSEVESPKK